MYRPYGQELILDIHDAAKLPVDRSTLRAFLNRLVKAIGMEAEDLHFWDYEGYPEEYDEAPEHLKGISAVQFVKTSSIVVHTLDDMKCVYINIFSCSSFNTETVRCMAIAFFGGRVVQSHTVDRK